MTLVCTNCGLPHDMFTPFSRIQIDGVPWMCPLCLAHEITLKRRCDRCKTLTKFGLVLGSGDTVCLNCDEPYPDDSQSAGEVFSGP